MEHAPNEKPPPLKCVSPALIKFAAAGVVADLLSAVSGQFHSEIGCTGVQHACHVGGSCVWYNHA